MSKMNNYFSFKALRDHPERIEQITNKIWTLFPKEQKVSTYSWALKNGKLAHLRQISSFKEDVCRNGLERRRASKARDIARRHLKLNTAIRNSFPESETSKKSKTPEVTEANSQSLDSSKTPEVAEAIVNSTNLNDSEAVVNSTTVNVPPPVQVDTNVTIRFVPYQSSNSINRPIAQSTEHHQSASSELKDSAHYTLTGLPDPPDFTSLINSTITRINSISPTDFNSDIVDQSTILRLMFENQQLLNENARLTELLFQKTEQVHALLQTLYERSS
jgi:hypothetical protein